MMRDIDLQAKAVLLAPGERLIFRTPQKLHAEQRRLICETIRNAFPGIEFIVIDGTLEISCGVAPAPLTESCEATDEKFQIRFDPKPVIDDAETRKLMWLMMHYKLSELGFFTMDAAGWDLIVANNLSRHFEKQ